MASKHALSTGERPGVEPFEGVDGSHKDSPSDSLSSTPKVFGMSGDSVLMPVRSMGISFEGFGELALQRMFLGECR